MLFKMYVHIQDVTVMGKSNVSLLSVAEVFKLSHLLFSDVFSVARIITSYITMSSCLKVSCQF